MVQCDCCATRSPSHSTCSATSKGLFSSSTTFEVFTLNKLVQEGERGLSRLI